MEKNDIHLFRELEIINDREVKIHCEYYFPKGEVLYIITNDVKDRLIAKDDSGVAIYKRIDVNNGRPNFVKWEIIKVINDFPYDLHEYY